MTPELEMLVYVTIFTTLLWIPYMVARITSAGFLETGLSGKMRIKTRPALICRCIATRAASIWRLDNHPFSIA